MKKVLVLGGTRFFGKRLVKGLVDSGYDVTIATREGKPTRLETRLPVCR
ncbi:NAD-dependent epimerase/dehydratase family protein [Brevibacillus borstelensis]|jgi:uncharacterized protein YbjT (DUF2867 family)|nr:NAD-dependent epimerase/dehydratase family protein [Brevibacillus borstelensis]MED1852411.1 NAD-dependent epimerase/dehydratase family protein [Brevibacillus borstelensis]NOU54048.1 NAD-dependent epimerase/dehydratase family protein [Brevibacillus borstelensis]